MFLTFSSVKAGFLEAAKTLATVFVLRDTDYKQGASVRKVLERPNMWKGLEQ